ncbi:hypothetical protein [Mycobacterium sp. IS-2888]|uniref:hypothetical protein n=1 Tax=Mycobacterium sp. IS-2888 TaxID=1834159 RepID=UPI001589A700|nr:hypothetical protein [Mycobacterium sp. IS-2888]
MWSSVAAEGAGLAALSAIGATIIAAPVMMHVRQLSDTDTAALVVIGIAWKSAQSGEDR